MGVKRTILTYDRMADRYAARPVHPLDREIERFVSLVGERGLALDMGCGRGQYARRLAARGLQVVALDLSVGMLAQARAAGTPCLLRVDMRWLPLRAGVVDGCFVCASLLHLPRAEVPGTLTEFRRALRPRGAIYLALKEGEGEEWVPAEKGARFFVYYQAAEVDHLLEGAGFQVVDGWVNPPGTGQRHRWINRFAVAR
jgi:SAM-dependent methyltransferase